MALTVGTRLGAYEILSAIGSGGMGHVYRARDTKLGRDVAIKVLARGAFNDAESLARLRREAQTLAALNHPHIAAIYGIEEAHDTQCLILELVDGETLDRYISRGPLPIDRVFEIAREIMAALDAAHASGIVHRDLKPSNIALTKSGAVKILDFGLAKTEPATGSPSHEAAEAQTVTAPPPLTAAGVILGTAAYMSPEQARGLATDRRSDIWSFGCVVYEMLTGRRLFEAPTTTDTLAAVLTRAPDWSPVPARARRLLGKCLERDPQRRLRDIGDASLLLEQPTPEQAPARKLPWIIAAASIASAALAIVLLWPARDARPFIRLPLDLGNSVAVETQVSAAISPDGSRLAFHARDSTGRRLLATRRLTDRAVTLLAGTEGADQPFFSPDGHWIGFFAGNKLKKISVQGGAPVDLADARIARGASWSDDGRIVAALSNNTGLSWIAGTGGPPQPVTTVSAGDPTHRWPQLLPGGRAVIFTANTPTLNSYEDATIDVQSLETGARKTLWRGGYFGRYVPSRGARGHLIYVRRGVLFAVPFDPIRLELEGAPAAFLDDIAANPGSGAGHFDLSRTGLMVYRSGVGLQPWTIASQDASGKRESILSKPALYYSPRFSPVDERLAVSIDSGKGADIYAYDWRHDQTLRLTPGGEATIHSDPVWAPDGKHLMFRAVVSGRIALWWVRTDGSAPATQLIDVAALDVGPNSFSPDGRRFIYSARGEGGTADLWTVGLDLSDADHPRPAAPEPFLASRFEETRPSFSPDGQWVAYLSDETGAFEVYVRSAAAGAPRSGAVRQISSGGGNQPIWSRTARELFYMSENRIMVTTYSTVAGTFAADKPRVWTTIAGVGDTGFSSYDLAPDGKRFAIFTRPDADRRVEESRINLLFNYFEEIRRLAPGK